MNDIATAALFVTATVSLTANQTWEKTSWQGEAAWASTQGALCAIISEPRARLIYLGSADRAHNLLNAPALPASGSSATAEPNRGGHRFWLGPQRRWGWPPPSDWEYAPAREVSLSESAVTLAHARTDPDFPALTREYAWEGNRLRCTVRWQDVGGAWFGLHVIAVDLPLSVVMRLQNSSDAPSGLLAAEMSEKPAPLVLPHPAIKIVGDHATVRSGLQTVKLGFTPQPIDLDRPFGWKLVMSPGPHDGNVKMYPDHGYLSQIWVGDQTHRYAEIEQLTPYLNADESGACSSTIYLEAIPPAP